MLMLLYVQAWVSGVYRKESGGVEPKREGES